VPRVMLAMIGPRKPKYVLHNGMQQMGCLHTVKVCSWNQGSQGADGGGAASL
jgi:hypothetical protein